MDRQDRIERFTREFLSYRPVLEAVVRRILGKRSEETADVLQDAWVKGAVSALRHPVTHYKSWLYQVATSAAFTHLQRSRRLPSEPNAKDARQEDVDPAPSPETIVACRQVLDAIDALEPRIPRLVAALRLVRLEECTFPEAAAALGVTEGTVKSNAFKAVEQLRARLTADALAA